MAALVCCHALPMAMGKSICMALPFVWLRCVSCPAPICSCLAGWCPSLGQDGLIEGVAARTLAYTYLPIEMMVTRCLQASPAAPLLKACVRNVPLKVVISIHNNIKCESVRFSGVWTQLTTISSEGEHRQPRAIRYDRPIISSHCSVTRE